MTYTDGTRNYEIRKIAKTYHICYEGYCAWKPMVLIPGFSRKRDALAELKFWAERYKLEEVTS